MQSILEKISNKKIGIWGYGVMGRSALRYLLLHVKTSNIEIFDQKALPAADQEHLKHLGISSFHEPYDLLTFLERNDVIIPSSGIDLRPYQQFYSKFLTELNFFGSAAAHATKTIAITGSIGKTTVTSLLGQLLNKAGYKAQVGGNIGTGLFDFLNSAPSRDHHVIELSSFQLEDNQTFAPDFAILTNIFPNHIDRHGTFDDYLRAKCKLFSLQDPHQQALVPFALKKELERIVRECFPAAKPNLIFFASAKPPINELYALTDQQKLYYLNTDDSDTQVMRLFGSREEKLTSFSELPIATFPENWLILCAALDLLEVPFARLANQEHVYSFPEHRLENVATINRVTFYNDSKSTTAKSTLAAVETLNKRHAATLHLFLGGTSKGVSREELCHALTEKVDHLYCFGKEAGELAGFCLKKEGRAQVTIHGDLDQAFNCMKQKIRPGDVVLFSPGGASFDLFANFAERGNAFKQLVASLL